jgi:GNAT superfamily N-acetyltransferase
MSPITRVCIATDQDREAVYRLRHDIYAKELQQVPENAEGRLTDGVDAYNVFLAAYRDPELVGFVSVTPPGGGPYAVEKYYPRERWPFPCDDGVFESRLLGVRADHRGQELLVTLVYAAFRYAEVRGARRLISNAHPRMIPFYSLAGLEPTGLRARAGALELELMSATVPRVRQAMARLEPLLRGIAAGVQWELDFPFLG